MLSLRRLLLSMSVLALVPFAGLCQDPVPLYPNNYKVLLENDRVRVLRFILRKGETEQFHTHPAAVTYVLAPFKIKFTFPGGTEQVREAKVGDVFYGDAVTHSPLNIGDTDAEGILVEMKGQASSGQKPADADLLTAVTFIRGLEGKEEELKQELLALSGPTRAEPDCLTYDLYQSPQHGNLFMRLEVWRNAEALEAHKMTPHIQASFKKRQEQGWTTEITTWKRVDDR